MEGEGIRKETGLADNHSRNDDYVRNAKFKEISVIMPTKNARAH